MHMETLVVTVDQHDHSLPERMNLQTDAWIGNQADFESEEQIAYKGNRVTFLTDTRRGVGRNRNKVLRSASADICIFADDDMRFVDGYPRIVEEAFSACQDGDILLFNLIEKHPRRYVNRRFFRVGWFRYGRYGGARIVIRRDRVMDRGIRFSHLFGGGAKYGSGEDTIFLRDCLKAGLKIVAVPYALAQIDQSARSSWFRGYDERFFRDKGALYACLYGKAALLFCVRFVLKYHRKYRSECSLRDAWQAMAAGRKDYRDTIPGNGEWGTEECESCS